MIRILVIFGKSSLLIVLLSNIFYACADKSVNIDNSVVNTFSERYQVNFMGQWMNEGKREIIVRDFVREYEFLNQDVDVNLKFPEEIGFDRYNTESTQSFMTQLLKKPLPDWDIILINDDMEGIANFAGDTDWAKKYLVDFSVYPEIANNTISEIDLADVKKRWNGIIPGPFLEGQYWALWINKNVTRKLGIEVNQFGMTFNDFLSYIKTCYEYNKTHDDHITPFQEAGDWRTFFSIVNQLYISIVNDREELFNLKLTETKLKAWYKTLQALEQLSAYDVVEDNWATLVWNDNRHKLLYEECLFFANGSWMYNIWSEEDEKKVMNCIPNEFPVINPPSIYPGGYPIMWGVLKNSPNKEQAIKFLLAMNQPSMAEAWVRNTKSPTGIKGNLADVSFGTDQFGSFSNHLQKTYGTNRYKEYENSRFIFGQDLINEPNYYMEVIMGELTADEAMAKIRASLEHKLKDN